MTGALSVLRAQVLGGPMAAGLLLMDGALGLRGWQWLFITEGALTCLCGLLLKVGAIPVSC